MDPVTSFGLAANVLQFGSFCWNLIDEAKQIYESGTGASEENDVLEFVADKINSFNNTLTASSTLGAIPETIRMLASRSKAVANELLTVLDTIKVKGTRRKWRSFLQALRSVWNKKQIEQLVTRLDRLRSAIQYGLQAITREENSEMQETLMKLVTKQEKLAMETTGQIQGLEKLAKEIRDSVRHFKDTTTSEKPVVNRKLEVTNISPITSAGTVSSSQIMEDLSTKFSTLATQIGVTAFDQMLLDSLWFDSIKDRQEKVAQTHGQTYEWVLDPASPTKFEEWLRNEHGIYWITGKPGSGKSTLMKYLMNHRSTSAIAKAWAGARKLVTTSYFFWNAGTTMQKSQEGLFKSLLYEILRQCPDMIRTVCASKAESFRPYKGELTPWTQQELWYAIGQLEQYSGTSVRFCIFIDGLDEYDGESDRLIEVLNSLRSWQDIKLCVSSRPWNEFLDAFGRPGDPTLTMEDLTREDIRLYVRETLEESSQFRNLQERDDRSQSLVQEIVDKARGVFLWVVLVIRSLLIGLRNEDRILDLQLRLRNFPETLEKFFDHMLGSIERIYLRHTAQTFRIALAKKTPLRLLTCSILDEENLDDLLASADRETTHADLERRCDVMRRRLNGRYKGLLEVVDRSSSMQRKWETLRVDFLHRTVYDYLRTKDIQNTLDEHLPPGFEPKILLCKAIFAHIKLIQPLMHRGNEELEELLEDLTIYAGELELETATPQIELMDGVAEFVSKHAILFNIDPERGDGFLEIIIRNSLQLYLTETLKRNPGMRPSTKDWLLMSALHFPYKYFRSSFYMPSMVQILLEHGASPNGRYEESTVWGNFLHSTFVKVSGVGPDDLKQTTKLMLCHGADSHLRVVVGQKTIPIQRDRGKGANLQRRIGAPVDHEYTVDNEDTVEYEYKSAEAIIRDYYGDEAEEILSRTQTSQRQSKPLRMRWKNAKFLQRLSGRDRMG
ncbi:hypothetical protein ACLMJK_005664 [Lecanora helva]